MTMSNDEFKKFLLDWVNDPNSAILHNNIHRFDMPQLLRLSTFVRVLCNYKSTFQGILEKRYIELQADDVSRPSGSEG